MEWHEDEKILSEIDGLLMYADGQVSSIMQRVYRYVEDEMTAERVMAFSLARFVRFYYMAREDGCEIEESARIAAASVVANPAFQQVASELIGMKFDDVVAVQVDTPQWKPEDDTHE